ncbi:MAG: phenylacetate--CoA ligase [Ruminococcaceae bacterium]|nr:phenylacetate--CoA ligase [Oscillospiraceae bacterium]
MPIYNKAVETAERHELEAMQSLALIRMVRHVYENVPIYRKKFDEKGVKPSDIKSVKDLSKLPFTYKADFQENYPYGMFAAPLSDVVRIHATSGTTGRQTVVGYTKDDMNIWAECVARAITAAGGTKEDVVHISYGYGLFTGGLGLHCGAEKIGATVVPVSTGNTDRQIRIFQDFGSTILGCTPSYALYLGDAVQAKGLKPGDLKLKAGIFGAEPWTEKMRTEIEKRLGIKAYDIYGLSEIMGPGVSFDCECRCGLHVNEDHFIPEIINPDTGEVLPYGEYGELVFTCITKQALPLVRYRTKDIACLNIEKCECGRTLVRMSKPKGRVDDMMIIRGVNVFPSQIEAVLLTFEDLSPHYQILLDRVNNLDTIEIQVEMSEKLFHDEIRQLEALVKEIKRRIESAVGISAKITLVNPNTIPRSEGKAKRVIDNRKFD